MSKEGNPNRRRQLVKFVNEFFLRVQIDSIPPNQTEREKTQREFFGNSEKADELIAYYQSSNREITEEDKNRHEWHKTNFDGFRLADDIKDSFGNNEGRHSSVHKLDPSDLKKLEDTTESAKILRYPITDDTSYSLEVVHTTPNSDKKIKPVDQLTLRAVQESGLSWESTLVINHGKVSYYDKIGHQLISSSTDGTSGEVITENARGADIHAFWKLLHKTKFT